MIMNEEGKGSGLAGCCRQRQSKSVEGNGRERPKGAYGIGVARSRVHVPASKESCV